MEEEIYGPVDHFFHDVQILAKLSYFSLVWHIFGWNKITAFFNANLGRKKCFYMWLICNGIWSQIIFLKLQVATALLAAWNLPPSDATPVLHITQVAALDGSDGFVEDANWQLNVIKMAMIKVISPKLCLMINFFIN